MLHALFIETKRYHDAQCNIVAISNKFEWLNLQNGTLRWIEVAYFMFGKSYRAKKYLAILSNFYIKKENNLKKKFYIIIQFYTVMKMNILFHKER